ncbi:MAG: hypothetical protein MJ086_05805 [Lachnospiraceae bacterium]|nr:hypothetical protein [Lachnospiraceae bacterium]
MKKKLVCILLSIVMLITMTPAFSVTTHAEEPAGVSPFVIIGTIGKINNAVKSIDKGGSLKAYTSVFDSIVKYSGTVQKVYKIFQSSFFQKLFGLSSGPKPSEPTVTLLDLYEGIQDIQGTLSEMNRKLDDVAKDIKQNSVRQEEIARANIASDMLKYWNDFEDNNIKVLDSLIADYELKTTLAIKAWYNSSDKEDLIIPYSWENSDETLLVHSTKDDIDVGVISDEGLKITRCLMIAGEDFDSLPAYDINTYRDNILSVMESKFRSSGYSSQEAEKYAIDAYDELLYRLLCDALKDDSAFASEVVSAVNGYLNDLLRSNDGISAQLQLLYNVYVFEGYAKDHIDTITNTMITRTALYGSFAQEIMSKTGLYSDAQMESMLEKWTGAIDDLDTIRNNAITGYDNYCYLTNTLVEVQHGTFVDLYQCFLKNNEITLSRQFNDRWRLEKIERKPKDYGEYWRPNDYFYDQDPTSLTMTDDIVTQMLYDTYLCSSDSGAASFAEYLAEAEADPNDWFADCGSLPILTEFDEYTDFQFSENLPMTAKYIVGKKDVFKEGATYKINSTGKSNSKFELHTKILADWMDPTTGKLTTNGMLAAASSYRDGNTAYAFNPASTKLAIVHDQGHTDWYGDHKHYYNADFTREVLLLMKKKVPENKAVQGTAPSSGEKSVNPLKDYVNVSMNGIGTEEGWMEETLFAPENEFEHTECISDGLSVIDGAGESEEAVKREYGFRIGDARARADLPELTGDELDELLDKMLELHSNFKTEASNNTTIASVNDPMGMENDLRPRKDMAAMVFEDLIEEGEFNLELMDSLDSSFGVNLKVSVAVEFVNGKAVLNPLYEAELVMYVNNYDETTHEVTRLSRVVPSEVQAYIASRYNLRTVIKLPAPNITDDESLDIIYYNDLYSMGIESTEKAEVKGEGNNRYVEIVDKPHFLVGLLVETAEDGPVNPLTGDSANGFLYFMILLASLTCVVGAFFVSRRLREKE